MAKKVSNTTKKASTKKTTAPTSVVEEVKTTEEVVEVKEETSAPKIVHNVVEDEKEQEIKALKEQLAEMSKQMADMQKTPQVVMMAKDDEKVMFLWQAEVSDTNTVQFGENGMYGRITGKTGSFYVPKSELSRILTTTIRKYLEKRWLIVVSGLDETEREALGVDYKEGEIIDKQAFTKIAQMGDELVDIYKELCDSHKEIVAKRLLESYENGNPSITRERILTLNKIKSVPAFTSIIESMNEKDLKGE